MPKSFADFKMDHIDEAVIERMLQEPRAVRLERLRKQFDELRATVAERTPKKRKS